MGDMCVPELPDWYYEEENEDGSGEDASRNSVAERQKRKRRELVNEVGVVSRPCHVIVTCKTGGIAR